jgi:hypothetical protein
MANPAICWVQGHLLLAIFSFADGVVSAYVMDYLGKMRVVRLLDTLYEVECFDRINDKVIFDASGVLTSYVEVIVIVQISVAFITAAFHFVKAFRREDMEGISSLSLMEAALELSELIASVAGYTQFMSAATSFYQMHTLMDGSRYRAAGPCMYSCCTSVSGFTPPGGAGAWSGSQPDAIVASAAWDPWPSWSACACPLGCSCQEGEAATCRKVLAVQSRTLPQPIPIPRQRAMGGSSQTPGWSSNRSPMSSNRSPMSSNRSPMSLNRRWSACELR